MMLRWSDQALRDLDDLYEGVFAACKDFETTDRYYEGLISKVEAKQEFPLSGSRLMWMGEWTGIFYVVYKEYIAFYRVNDNVMEVSRVELRKADHIKRLKL